MTDENVFRNWVDSVKLVGQHAASVRWIESVCMAFEARYP